MFRELWRPVEGFEGSYQVSSLGKVRRIKAAKGTKAGTLLRPFLQNKGYLLVDLREGRKRKTKALHRLVAETFIPNPLGLPEVNHSCY